MAVNRHNACSSSEDFPSSSDDDEPMNERTPHLRSSTHHITVGRDDVGGVSVRPEKGKLIRVDDFDSILCFKQNMTTQLKNVSD